MYVFYYRWQAAGFFIYFKLPVGAGSLLQYFMYMAYIVLAAQMRYYITHKIK